MLTSATSHIPYATCVFCFSLDATSLMAPPALITFTGLIRKLAESLLSPG